MKTSSARRYRSTFMRLSSSGLGFQAFFFLCVLSPTHAAVPTQMNHQGIVKVNGTLYSGTGQFRFAIVDPDSGQASWSNDGSINGGFGLPTGAVSLEVTNGLYSVRLGDTGLANMTAIPPSAFEDPNLVLRVWFDDGANGIERLLPDHPLTSSPYAFRSATSDSALNGTPSGFSILGETDDPPEGFSYTGQLVEAGDLWRTRASMPTPRFNLAVGVANNRIYALGGNDDTMADVGTNEEYDPVTNTWETKAPMPTPRSRFAIGTVRGKLYAIGGGPLPVNHNEEYNPVTDTWTPKAPMPTGRAALGVAVVEDKIYAIGGGIGGVGGANEEYDPMTDMWTPKAPMPTNRLGPMVGVMRKRGIAFGQEKENDSKGGLGVRDFILAVGGLDTGVFPTDVNEEYDPVNDTWFPRASLPSDRNGSAFGVANNRFYIIGGVEENVGLVGTNFEFDIGSNTWLFRREIPSRRSVTGSASLGDKIYVLGGADGDFNRLGTNEEYSPPKILFVHEKD